MASISDRYTEEALVASLFLDPDHLDETFATVSDDDCFYEDIRMIVRSARRTRPLTIPALFVALGPDLDRLRWADFEAESLIVDIVAKFTGDVSAFYGPAVAAMVHRYAEGRRRHERALRAAQEAADAVLGRETDAQRLRERFQ